MSPRALREPAPHASVSRNASPRFQVMRTRFLSTFGLLTVLAACGGPGTNRATVAAPTGAGGGAAVGGSPQPLTMATGGDAGGDSDDGDWGIVDDASYPSVVEKVVAMVGDPAIRRSAERRGLAVQNIMWEDTGRAEGSALGPNITDLTLQVRYRERGAEGPATALMPVIRFPNFSDRTGDVAADKFLIRVGNHERGRGLTTVPLTDVLSNLRRYASQPSSIAGSGNLLARRDTHFLVSAQAVFLPIPTRGKAEFNPVVYNYQSAPGSPAVLTLLVTREGTSMRVIDNRAEESGGQGWGQELYFNDHGRRAAFTAERRSDVARRIEAQGGPKTADERSQLARGADVIFLVQVPLKHRNRGRLGGVMYDAEPAQAPATSAAAPTGGALAPSASRAERSDVERAVVGHGRSRGPFEEGGGLRLERDERFPIRVTVQFYKATSNGVADERDLDAIAQSIGSVYEHADFVGSLVIPDGDPRRPTSWQRVPREWFPW